MLECRGSFISFRSISRRLELRTIRLKYAKGQKRFFTLKVSKKLENELGQELNESFTNSCGNTGEGYAPPASCRRFCRCSRACFATCRRRRRDGQRGTRQCERRVWNCPQARRTRASRTSSVSSRQVELKQQKRQIRISQTVFCNTLQRFPRVFHTHAVIYRHPYFLHFVNFMSFWRFFVLLWASILATCIASFKNYHTYRPSYLFCFLFMYVIQHCFICRLTDSAVTEDAQIEPRTVATLALTARRYNYSVFQTHSLLPISADPKIL